MLRREKFEDIDVEELRKILLAGDADYSKGKRVYDGTENAYKTNKKALNRRIQTYRHNAHREREMVALNSAKGKSKDEHERKMNNNGTKEVWDPVHRIQYENHSKVGSRNDAENKTSLPDVHKTISHKSGSLPMSVQNIKATSEKFQNFPAAHDTSENVGSNQGSRVPGRDSVVFSSLEAIAHNLLRVLKRGERLKGGSKLRYEIRRDDLLRIRDFIWTTRNPKVTRKVKIQNAKEALNAIKHLLKLIKKKNVGELTSNNGNGILGNALGALKRMHAFSKSKIPAYEENVRSNEQENSPKNQETSAGKREKANEKERNHSMKGEKGKYYSKLLKGLRLKLLKNKLLSLLKTKVTDQGDALKLNSLKSKLLKAVRQRRNAKAMSLVNIKKGTKPNVHFTLKKNLVEENRRLRKIVKININKLKRIIKKYKDVQTGSKRFLLVHGQNSFRKNLISLASLDANKMSGEDLKKLHDKLNEWIHDEEMLERTKNNGKTKSQITTELNKSNEVSPSQQEEGNNENGHNNNNFYNNGNNDNNDNNDNNNIINNDEGNSNSNNNNNDNANANKPENEYGSIENSVDNNLSNNVNKYNSGTNATSVMDNESPSSDRNSPDNKYITQIGNVNHGNGNSNDDNNNNNNNNNNHNYYNNDNNYHNNYNENYANNHHENTNYDNSSNNSVENESNTNDNDKNDKNDGNSYNYGSNNNYNYDHSNNYGNYINENNINNNINHNKNPSTNYTNNNYEDNDNNVNNNNVDNNSYDNKNNNKYQNLNIYNNYDNSNDENINNINSNNNHQNDNYVNSNNSDDNRIAKNSNHDNEENNNDTIDNNKSNGNNGYNSDNNDVGGYNADNNINNNNNNINNNNINNNNINNNNIDNNQRNNNNYNNINDKNDNSEKNYNEFGNNDVNNVNKVNNVNSNFNVIRNRNDDNQEINGGYKNNYENNYSNKNGKNNRGNKNNFNTLENPNNIMNIKDNNASSNSLSDSDKGSKFQGVRHNNKHDSESDFVSNNKSDNHNIADNKPKVDNSDYEDGYDYSDEDEEDDSPQTTTIRILSNQNTIEKPLEHEGKKTKHLSNVKQETKDIGPTDLTLPKEQNININLRVRGTTPLYGKGPQIHPVRVTMLNDKTSRSRNAVNYRHKYSGKKEIIDNEIQKAPAKPSWKNYKLQNKFWRYHRRKPIKDDDEFITIEQKINTPKDNAGHENLEHNQKVDSQYFPANQPSRIFHRRIQHRGRTPQLHEESSSNFNYQKDGMTSNVESSQDYKDERFNYMEMGGNTLSDSLGATNEQNEKGRNNLLPKKGNEDYHDMYNYLFKKNNDHLSHRPNQKLRPSTQNFPELENRRKANLEKDLVGNVQEYKSQGMEEPEVSMHQLNGIKSGTVQTNRLKMDEEKMSPQDQEVNTNVMNKLRVTKAGMNARKINTDENNQVDVNEGEMNEKEMNEEEMNAGKTNAGEMNPPKANRHMLGKSLKSNSDGKAPEGLHGKALLSDFLSEENKFTSKVSNNRPNSLKTVHRIGMALSNNNVTGNSPHRFPVRLLEPNDEIKSTNSSKIDKNHEFFDFRKLAKINGQIRGSMRNRMTNVINVVTSQLHIKAKHPRYGAKIMNPSASDLDGLMKYQPGSFMPKLRDVPTTKEKTKATSFTRKDGNKLVTETKSATSAAIPILEGGGVAEEDEAQISNPSSKIGEQSLPSETQTIPGAEKVTKLNSDTMENSVEEPDSLLGDERKIELAQKTSEGDVMSVGKGTSTTAGIATAANADGIPPEHVLVSPDIVKDDNDVHKPLAQDPDGTISAIQDVQAIGKAQKEQEYSQQDNERMSDPAFLEGVSNRIQVQGAPLNELAVTHTPSVPLRDINFPGSTLMVSSDKLKRDEKASLVGNETSLLQDSGRVPVLSVSNDNTVGTVAPTMQGLQLPVTRKVPPGQLKLGAHVQQLVPQGTTPHSLPHMVEHIQPETHEVGNGTDISPAQTVLSSTQLHAVPQGTDVYGIEPQVAQSSATKVKTQDQTPASNTLANGQVSSHFLELVKAIANQKKPENVAGKTPGTSSISDSEKNGTNEMAEEIFDDPTKFGDSGILLNSEKQETKPYDLPLQGNNMNTTRKLPEGTDNGKNFDASRQTNSSSDESKASVFIPNISTRPDGEQVYLGRDSQASNLGATMSTLSKSNLSNEEKLKLINLYQQSQKPTQSSGILAMPDTSFAPSSPKEKGSQSLENFPLKTGKANGHELKGDVAGKEAAMEDLLMLEKEREMDNKLSQAHLLASQPDKLKGDGISEGELTNTVLPGNGLPNSELQRQGNGLPAIYPAENMFNQNSAQAKGPEILMDGEKQLDKLQEDVQHQSSNDIGQDDMAGEMLRFPGVGKLRPTSKMFNSKELNTGVEDERKAIENIMEPGKQMITDGYNGANSISKFVESIQGLSPAEMKAYGINVNNDAYIDKPARQRQYDKPSQATYNAMMEEAMEATDALKEIKKSNVNEHKKKMIKERSVGHSRRKRT